MNATDSEIVMGENEEGHLGSGWFDFEPLAVPIRWTGSQAQVFLVRREEHIRLGVGVNSGPANLGPVQLTLTAGDVARRSELLPEAWTELVIPLPKGDPGPLLVILGVDRIRNPKQLGLSQDDRDLGVMVRQIRLMS
jgi:hypothetical protein